MTLVFSVSTLTGLTGLCCGRGRYVPLVTHYPLHLVPTRNYTKPHHTYNGQGAFLPVILEQLARENGVFFSDHSKPCIDHAPSGKVGRGEGAATKKQGEEQCIVKYLGKDMSTSSFAMYTFSTAVLLQALVLICFSSFADHGMFPCCYYYTHTHDWILMSYKKVHTANACSCSHLTPAPWPAVSSSSFRRRCTTWLPS